VPCANVGSVGLGGWFRNGEIQKILDYLRGRYWQQRRLERPLKENSIACERIAARSRRSPQKPDRPASGQATFIPRKKKMLERARYLLVSELAMARNVEETQIEDLLTKPSPRANCDSPRRLSSKPDDPHLTPTYSHLIWPSQFMRRFQTRMGFL